MVILAAEGKGGDGLAMEKPAIRPGPGSRLMRLILLIYHKSAYGPGY
jgi:hypothetical protein